MIIARDIPSILAGSAMTGFGFSFGRDIYRSTKKVASQLILIIFFVLCILITRQSMIWLFRNYKTIQESIVIKALAIIIYLIGAILSWVIFALLIDLMVVDFLPQEEKSFFLKSFNVVEIVINNALLIIGNIFSTDFFIREDFAGELNNISYRSKMVYVCSGLIILFLTINGIYSGIKQRMDRAVAWGIAKYNQEFLSKVGLTQVTEEKFEDSNGNSYRLENVGSRYIELFALGRRNKRGYIRFDSTGLFLEWTGLVSKTT